jgi:16S rRNA (uracil1498-N3)-methyltransferase
MEPSTIRLHCVAELAAGRVVDLETDQVHRLRNVLRLGPGAAVALFNARDGEWFGHIEALARQNGSVRLDSRRRPPDEEPGPWLLFAPVKRAPIDLIVEKATELGVACLQPVLTRRTIVARVNLERLTAHAVEAAEQCERLTVPKVLAPTPLLPAIAALPAGFRLIVADETGAAAAMAGVLAAWQPPYPGIAVLVGPEGGFASDELDALSNLPNVTRVGLGPRVLRADTASLAALAVLQALIGDWGRRRGHP